MTAGSALRGFGSAVTDRRYRRKLLLQPLDRRDRALRDKGRQRNLAPIDSAIAELAEVAEPAPVQHPGQFQRGQPLIVLADEELGQRDLRLFGRLRFPL